MTLSALEASKSSAVVPLEKRTERGESSTFMAARGDLLDVVAPQSQLAFAAMGAHAGSGEGKKEGSHGRCEETDIVQKYELDFC